MPPRSAALARQIHHPDTQRVISWGLGNTAATRGHTSMKARKHAEAWSPQCSLHFTLDWSKNHTRACNVHIPAVQPESSATLKMLTAGEKTGFYLQSGPFFNTTNVLHETNTASTHGIEKKNPWRLAVRTKQFPRSSFLKHSSARSNFRFATQLLRIQSSFWLSGWLAAPPKQSPHCLELVVLPVCLSPLKYD